MSSSPFVARLLERGAETGAIVSEPEALQLERYYELLRRWNARMNLTSLPLDIVPASGTLDRLFLEPIAAAAFIENQPLNCFDLGSGGGSPAIPLKIVRERIVLTMVEARERKTAFLREVVRELGLMGVTVLTARAEAQPASSQQSADVVTLRAVRPDPDLMRAVRNLLKPTGRLVTFGSSVVPDGFELTDKGRLRGTDSVVSVFRATALFGDA